MKILDSIWFTNGTGVAGIVRVEVPHDGIKYYIGCIDNVMSEPDDAKRIADWGSTFPSDAGDMLFGVRPRIGSNDIFDALVREGEGRN
jgi:hypothetical protein